MEAEELFIPVMASCLDRQTSLLHRRERNTRGMVGLRHLDLRRENFLGSGVNAT